MPKIGKSPYCYYLGIDPGASGGLAVINDAGHVVELLSMPETNADKWAAIKRIATAYSPRAVIEKVGGYVGEKEGVMNNTGSSMFVFGYNTGTIAALCVPAGISLEEVSPQKWQRGLEIPIKKKARKARGDNPAVSGESSPEFKRRLKQKAQSLFPLANGITLKTADALLIAEYCRRKHK